MSGYAKSFLRVCYLKTGRDSLKDSFRLVQEVCIEYLKKNLDLAVKIKGRSVKLGNQILKPTMSS